MKAVKERYQLTHAHISGSLLTRDVPWLDEARMEMAFGSGIPPVQPEKGYGQEWHFIRPGVYRSQGFTVYFRDGRASIGGCRGDRLEHFLSWLQAQLGPETV